MKKKLIAAVLVGVALTVLFDYLLRPTYTYMVNDGSGVFNEWEAQALQEFSTGVFSSDVRREPPVHGDIYTVTAFYPFGRDMTYVFIPYLWGNILNVGTAGSADWMCEYGVVVMAWRGDEQIELKKVKINADLTISSDENTLLDLDSTSITNHIRTDFRFPPGMVENRAFFMDNIHAATINSTLEENKPCTATLHWEGKCTVPRTLFRPDVGVRFEVEAELPYVGNVK